MVVAVYAAGHSFHQLCTHIYAYDGCVRRSNSNVVAVAAVVRGGWWWRCMLLVTHSSNCVHISMPMMDV